MQYIIQAVVQYINQAVVQSIGTKSNGNKSLLCGLARGCAVVSAEKSLYVRFNTPIKTVNMDHKIMGVLQCYSNKCSETCVRSQNV